MKPLIPHIIQEHFLLGQNEGSFDAYTLFLDLSGFTAMTETLMQRGNEGAEELSNILNQIFEPLVKAVYAQNGFIPYFAGDAFNAVFPVNLSPIKAEQVLLLAQDFITKFGANQYSDEFIIKCKIGVSFGKVEWGIVGDKHKNFYFRGDAIEQSADCQTKAAAQGIVFDSFLKEKIISKIDFQNKSEHYFQLLPQQFDITLLDGEHQISTTIDEQVGKVFLPQSVIEFNQSGEFREIVTVFISFEGVSTHQEFNHFATIVLDQINNFSGYFKEIDFGDKGGVMLAFFGAPLSFENNKQRALEFALSILEESEALQNIKLSIGISSGLAYTGIIGGKERAQYAAVGSRVNLAARLMMEAANGQIYTDQEVGKTKGYNFVYEGNIAYKGISKNIPTYRLLNKKSEEEVSFAGKMIGRQEELAELVNAASPIIDNEFAGIAILYGEAGIGKSRMTFELRKSLTERGVNDYIVCQADQILRKPFNPFIYALKNYFGQSADKTLKDNKIAFDKNYDNLLSDCLEANHHKADSIIRELIRTKSILAGLVGLSEEGTLWLELDAKGRYENTVAAIHNFFLSEAMLHPLVIEIEDGHWIDTDSLQILPDLVQKLSDFPVFFLITSRYNDDGSKPTYFSTAFFAQHQMRNKEVDLNILKTEALQAMAELRLGGEIDEALLEFLHRASNGNPFYAEQMLEYFTETALLEKNGIKWTIKDKTMKLSGSINAVLMARVDRLSYLVKETVKAAAVIGREFEIPILSEVMKKQDEFIKKNGNQHLLLKEQIQTAERSQIWWAMNELRYIFKHSLLREAIYEMQLRARLRELHRLIAEAIEKVYSDNIEERFADLAFHYEQADETELTIEYLEKAASYAKRNYQNRQALEYYEKLQTYYEEGNETVELIKLLLKKGEIEQLLGTWKEAESTFTTALMRTTVYDDEVLSARANNALGSLLMLKGQYTSAKDYFEQGLVIFEKHDDSVGLSKSFGSLANLNFRQGNYDLAKQYFVKCINIARNVDEKFINPQIIANLGLTFMNLNDYDEGVRTIQNFLPVTERSNDRLGLASLHTNLGIIYFEKGDYDAALKHYQDGLAISQELGNKLLISIAVGCIGSVYERKGDFKKALEHFEEDLELTEALGDKQGIAIAYGLLGGHFSIRGDFDKALSYLKPNLKLCEELGYQKGIIKALNNLGDVAYFQNQLADAVSYYKRSIEVAQKINNRLLNGISVIELCHILLESGNQEELSFWTEKLEDFQDIPNREFQFEYLIFKSEFYRNSNETKKAEDALQKALQMPNLSAEEEASIYYELALLYPNVTSWKPRVLKAYTDLYAKTPKFLYQFKMKKI